jgi:hypothetical protein
MRAATALAGGARRAAAALAGGARRAAVARPPAALRHAAARFSTSSFVNTVTLTPAAAGGAAPLLTLAFAPSDGVRAAAFACAPSDSLAVVAERARAALGAARVEFLVGGARARAPAATPLSSAFGSTLEVELDGVRYSVNEGLRLGPTGAGVRQSKYAPTVAMWVGGALVTAAICRAWVWVIPEGHSRI